MLSVQINLRTIIKNVAIIKKHLQRGTQFCAVVKDNAYGFGLVRISRLLVPYVDCFAVSTIEEGITLRKNGIRQDILILGVCTDIVTAIQYNLMITVENIAQVRTLHEQQLHPRIHLAVNTGMNRFGFSSIHELRTALQILSQEQVEGIYTHLAYEDDQPLAIKNALERFKKFTQISQQYFPHIIKHAGCSGTLNYPIAHLDMVRIGKALYGGITMTQTALTVTSQIVSTKKIKTGTTVGYNGTFTAHKPMVIGIVRGGYVDGIPTQFGNTVKVLVNKQPCPIIGRVCMDYCMIDVSGIKQPLKQPVTIIAPQSGQTLLDVAQQAKMITCDLLHHLTAAQQDVN